MPEHNTLIVSGRIIPAYQLAGMMRANGFLPRVEHHVRPCGADIATSLSILITDIDDPGARGLEIAQWRLAHAPELTWFAMCSGGNTPAMQLARSLMADGFFFLTMSGLVLDYKRGAARLLPQYLKPPTPHHGMNARMRITCVQHAEWPHSLRQTVT